MTTSAKEMTRLQDQIMDGLALFDPKTNSRSIDAGCYVSVRRIRSTKDEKVHEQSSIAFSMGLVKTIVNRYGQGLPKIPDPTDPMNEQKKITEIRLAVSLGKGKADPLLFIFNPSANMNHLILRRGKSTASVTSKALVDALWKKLRLKENTTSVRLGIHLETTISGIGFYTVRKL